MSETPLHHATVEVPAGGSEHQEPSVINVSGSMMVLTWITFAISAAILYKVAWKPILAGLDRREDGIRKAIEEAEKTRAAYADIGQQQAKLIAEADTRARDIVEKARRAAVESAQTIEGKAREESQILLENARREIQAEHAKAMASLRRESAELAIDISRKVLHDNLDEARSRKIADAIIERI